MLSLQLKSRVNNTIQNVSYNVFYLDIICEYSDNPLQFIGWNDFKHNNNVMYNNVFLLNCLMYSEIKNGCVVTGINVVENVMSNDLLDAEFKSGVKMMLDKYNTRVGLKGCLINCQIIFQLDAEFESGVRRMLDNCNRSNDKKIQKNRCSCN